VQKNDITNVNDNYFTLFSVINLLQRNVATLLKCDGIVNDQYCKFLADCDGEKNLEKQ